MSETLSRLQKAGYGTRHYFRDACAARSQMLLPEIGPQDEDLRDVVVGWPIYAYCAHAYLGDLHH